MIIYHTFDKSPMLICAISCDVRPHPPLLIQVKAIHDTNDLVRKRASRLGWTFSKLQNLCKCPLCNMINPLRPARRRKRR